ncbi:MAG: RES family NAD+ phosphorylase [Chromatiaceae bacterium]
MDSRHRPRDSRLIDALEAHAPKPFGGTVWRAVRESRDPATCSAAGGRWDDATFDVLYTAQERDGAVAEMHFHLMRGQPIFPSKARYKLYELNLELDPVLDLSSADDLTALGVDMRRFGQLSYEGRGQEYPATQQIAEAAYFLGFSGLLVPSARFECVNVIVFCDPAGPAAVEIVRDHGLIDWQRWRKSHADHR